MAYREFSPEDRRLISLNNLADVGPAYPDMGGAVAKFRRLAAKAGSIAAMPKAERFAYGLAVEKAIHAKNNAWWRAGAAIAEGPAREVGAVLRAKHAAALAACPGAVRRARSPGVWEAMYVAAMAEKAKRASAPIVAVAAPVVAAKPVAVAAKPMNAAHKAWATRRARAAAAAEARV